MLNGIKLILGCFFFLLFTHSSQAKNRGMASFTLLSKKFFIAFDSDTRKKKILDGVGDTLSGILLITSFNAVKLFLFFFSKL